MTPKESGYSVYVHINKMNGMKYFGCTGMNPPSSRWGQSGCRYNNGQEKFYNAIKEFGWDNFEHIVLKTGLSEEDALTLEEKLIKEHNTVENGYNAAYGGIHNYLSDDSKEKLREQRLGDKNPNYNPNKIHGNQRVVDKYTKKVTMKKAYTFLPDIISTDGRKSIEFSKSMREAKLGEKNPNYGKHTWCYGLKMNDEQKQRMRDAWTDERKELARNQKLGGKNCQSKKVICLTTCKVYETIVEASKDTNVSERAISECCNGRVKKPRVMFAFIEEGEKK